MRKHIRLYRWGLWTVAAGVACLWALAAQAGEDKFEVGEQAPVFTLKAINAEGLGTNAYIGLDTYVGHGASDPKKAVLLSFFASDCEPCKREMPFLALLFDSYKDRGLQVLSVSIDKEQERIDIARALGAQNNVKYPILSDHFNYVARRFMINKLPCVYLINAEGKVVMVNIGYTEDLTKQLHDEVRRALGLPSSDPVPPALVAYFAAPREAAPAPAAPPPPPAPVAAPPAPAAASEAPSAADDDVPVKKGKGKKKGKAKKKAKQKQQQQN